MATTKRISAHGRRPQKGPRQRPRKAEDQVAQVGLAEAALFSALATAVLCVGCRSSSPSPPPFAERASVAQAETVQTPAVATPPNQAIAQGRDADDRRMPKDLQTVAFEEELQAPQAAPPGLEAAPLEEIQPEPLGVQDVLTAVRSSYPLLASAYLNRDVAAGENISAWGDFDLKLKASSISRPEGFYQTYRQAVSVEQPLYSGGYLYGGYRLGEGNFPPWYGGRQTNGGGEFAAGVGIPLLKDRAIDKRRAELYKAQLERNRVEPEILADLIEFSRVATIYYWDWVAAGQAREAQKGLLELAEERVQNIQMRIELGDLKAITRINNEQLIALRETKLIESERKLQSAAIKLSLFFRDPAGEPLLPHESLLPSFFPAARMLTEEEFAGAPDAAIAASPLLAEMDWKIRQTQIDLDQAENSLLPKLDAQLYASKDIGDPTSEKGDKTPFELELGLFGEVPLQRRQAFGKVSSTQAKLQQLSVKRRFTAEKTVAAVQDAVSALLNARERIHRAEQNVRLADEAMRLAEIQFNEGDIDIVELNIYEQATTDARLIDISA
ncbi:MAG: TolC family protein, partial [Blastopirellula sp. JB062]